MFEIEDMCESWKRISFNENGFRGQLWRFKQNTDRLTGGGGEK